MPAHTSVFTGNTRGYYFTAPSCFTITGIEVPTEASAGAQNVAIMRFQATPPLYSATTNVFTLLHLTQNGPTTGSIPVNIQVEQGDIIGVLASRATANSYSPAPYNTTIEGITTPLYRLGMQYTLSTTTPQNIWTENGSSISRCWLYYDSLITFTASNSLISGSDFSFTSNADTSFTTTWDFGDGSPVVVADNPTHTYTAQGTYNACAYITTSCGTDTVCTQVIACPAVVSNFSIASTGMTIMLTDSSAADSITWDFGDGNTGSGPSPTHTYSAPGTYTVCQTAMLSCGSTDTTCFQISVCEPPVAIPGIASNIAGTVSFIDSSMFATSWAWDFGDGSTDSVANPTHTYAASGAYNVCLIASNLCGSDTLCWTVPACLTTPTAAFSSSSSFLNWIFTDLSTGASTYLWDFGDGTTDTTMIGMHTYAASGTYTVCLTVMNACGDASTICDTITTCAAAAPGYSVGGSGLTANFTNTTTGASSYFWDFGDGANTTISNPSHTYAASGSYFVCLTAINACGDSTMLCDSVAVPVVGLGNSIPGFVLELAPNPVHDAARLLVKADGMNSNYEFSLTDLSGRRVHAQQGSFGLPMTLQRNGLAAGVYLYRVVAEGKVLATGKLVMD